MMSFRKKPRLLAREEGVLRDACKFVVATEDTHLPRKYFRLFKSTRIQVDFLPTDNGESSPEHVVERLAKFKSEHEVADDDELWLMLDRDHWTKNGHVANFSNVCARANQMGILLAHSNPCFELWLLLHFTELDVSEQLSNYDEVRQRIIAITGSCSKRTLDMTKYTLESAAIACERAQKLDQNPEQRWPEKTGTHVYRIVKRLLG